MIYKEFYEMSYLHKETTTGWLMNRVLYQLLGGNGGGIDGAVIDHCDLWFMLDTEDRLMFDHKNGMVWLHVLDQTIFEDIWTILDWFLQIFTDFYKFL